MNETIFFFFYNLAHQSNFFDHAVIFFGIYLPYLVWALAFLFLLLHHDVFVSPNPLKEFIKKWKEIFFVFFTGVVAWIAAHVLKVLINVPRPFDAFPQIEPIFPATGNSFPSGHATFFMALGVSIFLLHKKAGWVFMFLALLIGMARIIAGVHFPIDILGGFALGALVALFMKKLR